MKIEVKLSEEYVNMNWSSNAERKKSTNVTK